MILFFGFFFFFWEKHDMHWCGLSPKPKSTEISTLWITSSSKVKPIKLKEGSTLMSQERIEDVLNSILEGQEKKIEELA